MLLAAKLVHIGEIVPAVRALGLGKQRLQYRVWVDVRSTIHS
jgi:hypothetical protein